MCSVGRAHPQTDTKVKTETMALDLSMSIAFTFSTCYIGLSCYVSKSYENHTSWYREYVPTWQCIRFWNNLCIPHFSEAISVMSIKEGYIYQLKVARFKILGTVVMPTATLTWRFCQQCVHVWQFQYTCDVCYILYFSFLDLIKALESYSLFISFCVRKLFDI